MAPIVSHKKADFLSLIIFSVFAIFFGYIRWFWPGMLLPVMFALLARQYLRGRIYDMAVTVFVFFGLFSYFSFPINWDVIMPILFTIGGIYLIFSEYLIYRERVGKEKIIDAEKELEDERE